MPSLTHINNESKNLNWQTYTTQPRCTLTVPFSQTRVQPLSPASEACVRADVRVPAAASQQCLRYRDDPKLSYGLLHPPSECVRGWGHNGLSSAKCCIQVHMFQSQHCHVKMHLCISCSAVKSPPPNGAPVDSLYFFNEIQVLGSFTKGSYRPEVK